MAAFTPTQGRYLSFILAYMDAYGLPPAETDIAEALEVSAPSANQMVRTLESKKFITRVPGVARSIEVNLDSDEIPEWKGKMPPRFEKVWATSKQNAKLATDAIIRARLSRRDQKKLAQSDAKTSKVYQFKITLKGTSPPIWRKIETFDVTLEKFHQLIQRAMGWTNSHLHHFVIANEQFTGSEMADEEFGEQSYENMRLSTVLGDCKPKSRFLYVYDFGDDWQHEIVLEKTFDSQPGVLYPLCSGGKRACPPENVGGVWGFEEFLEAISDPSHPEHQERLEWSGPFAPDECDPSEITEKLRSRSIV